MPPARPRFEGTITTWHDARGFGFVQPEHGGDPLFVHVKGFRRANARPHVGQRIGFEVELIVAPTSSSKAAFRSTFRGTVAANVAAFVVLASPIARALLA